jgi:hypothetical protein
LIVDDRHFKKKPKKVPPIKKTAMSFIFTAKRKGKLIRHFGDPPKWGSPLKELLRGNRGAKEIFRNISSVQSIVRQNA